MTAYPFSPSSPFIPFCVEGPIDDNTEEALLIRIRQVRSQLPKRIRGLDAKPAIEAGLLADHGPFWVAVYRQWVDQIRQALGLIALGQAS